MGGLSGVDPQNFGPGSVGRKFGSGGVGSVGNCLCYLIILYRKHCVFYRILYNCTNRIQQALQLLFVILDLFHASLIQMKHVYDSFLDFQIFSRSTFFVIVVISFV